MLTIKDIISTGAGEPGDDLSGKLTSLRVSAVPLERAAQRLRLFKSIAGTALLSSFGVIATLALVSFSPLVGALGGLFTFGMLAALGQAIERYKEMSKLWQEWSPERAEQFTDQYRLELASAKGRPHRWNGPMLGAWGAACVIGSIWALSAGHWFVGMLVAVGAAIFVISIRQSQGRKEMAQRGAQLANEPAGSDPQMARALAEPAAKVGVHRVTRSFDVPDTTELIWRCQIVASGTQGMKTTRGDGLVQERAPQDVMAVTNHGIHFLNVSEPAQPWDGLGQGDLTDAATAQLVSQTYSGITSLKDLVDLGGRKLDSLAAAHGYKIVADADRRNLIFARSDILYAGIYERRFVSSFYLELDLIDGTTATRDMVIEAEGRQELELLLTDLGYQPRPD